MTLNYRRNLFHFKVLQIHIIFLTKLSDFIPFLLIFVVRCTVALGLKARQQFCSKGSIANTKNN